MRFTAEAIAYKDTRYFSKIVLDYLSGAQKLRPFYAFTPDLDGLKNAIAAKQQQPLQRAVLVQCLQLQYAKVQEDDGVLKNIESLLSPNTFTVCTAHQPNLFTGPLYFIYKILHAIKLADHLKQQWPQYHFVPVYYMGAEDADKEELNHTYVNGIRREWETTQTGAVGAMQSDKALQKLINDLQGELGVAPFGNEWIQLLKEGYKEGAKVEDAIFHIVHGLFKKFGLVVLMAGHRDLKKLMQRPFEEDLLLHKPYDIVQQTGKKLSEHYQPQAHVREINLFYLSEGIRNRIVREKEHFYVQDTGLAFTKDALQETLQNHPERFSPNVILRGLYQETILPNIAFIGGGGELAYWLQLRDLFDHYNIVFPVLILRNSFAVIEQKENIAIEKLGLHANALFLDNQDMMNAVLQKRGKLPDIQHHIENIEKAYGLLKKLAADADAGLAPHVAALQAAALKKLITLQKKMQRAERKKNTALSRQVDALKEHLFPGKSLQERKENIAVFYSKWGEGFIDALLQHSPALTQEFIVLKEV